MTSILKTGKYEGKTYKEVIDLDPEYCGDILSGYPILTGRTHHLEDIDNFKDYIKECLHLGSKTCVCSRKLDELLDYQRQRQEDVSNYMDYLVNDMTDDSMSYSYMKSKYVGKYAYAVWWGVWYKVVIEEVNPDKTLLIRWLDDGDTSDFYPNYFIKNIRYDTHLDQDSEDEWYPDDDKWYPGYNKWYPGYNKWYPGEWYPGEWYPGDDKWYPGDDKWYPGDDKWYPGCEDDEEWYPGCEDDEEWYPGCEDDEEWYPGCEDDEELYPGCEDDE